MTMTCGIYKITEHDTGRCYIGKSKHIERRWVAHRRKDYPLDKFSYEVIMECDAEQLDFWEIAWITSERSVEFGFNKTVGGNGAWSSKISDETRLKLSQAQLGKKKSEETKSKIAKANLGAKRSDEARLAMSQANKAYWAARRLNA